MRRINLLPARYRTLRQTVSRLNLVMAGIAALVIVVGTVHVAIVARARSYEVQALALRQDARQYRAINQTMDSLVKAERLLKARRDKALPLLVRGDSILPAVDELTSGLPTGAYLSELSVTRDGKVELSGEARTFKDVSRFVKWAGAVRRLQNVKLTQVGKSTNAGGTTYVTFTVSAVRPVRAGDQPAAPVKGGSAR